MMHFLSTLNAAKDDLEPQYRDHYLAADARQSSVAIIVWLIPVMLFAYADYMLFGASAMFAALLTVRLAFCVFSLYTIYALKKVATAREYDRVFLRWAFFGVVAVLIFSFSWARYVPPNGAITALIIFSAYMIFPNRLSVRFVPPLTLTVGNMLMQWWLVEPVNPNSLFNIVVALFMANLLGVIFSAQLQKHRRTEFKARLEENRIREELSRLASIDDLTGVFNRRKLMQLAAEEYERFRGDGQPVSVLMIDIDHFKKLNDNYGHEAGDLILSNFAAFVANSVHERSIWGRLGGEEFVLVLPNLSADQAKLVAERVRLGLNGEPVVWQGEPLTFTVSIGVTEAREVDQSFENVLKRADKALYRAKLHGRNKTEVL